MRADVLLRYDAPAPRYTSYPTAPHFTPDIDGACYAEWLTGLPPGETLSLYLHVPFCDTLCWFCGCNTTVVRRYEPVQRYLAVLLSEVEAVAARLGGGRPVSHIHFGGGSPSILQPDDWCRVLERLHARFHIAAGAEIAVEIDPRSLSNEQVAALAEVGVTRVSLGVQDFDADVQRAVNRIQPFDLTRSTVERFRAVGIPAINIDLMYGLPGQSERSIVRTMDQVVGLAPDRLALFGYAHVPWLKRHQQMIDESALPSARERLAQFGAAAERLVAAGYVWIGLDHFAKPDDGLTTAFRAGRLRRNFQGYTDDPAKVLLGFGASAIGELPDGYVQNFTKVPDYAKRLAAAELPVQRGVRLTADDRLRRAIIEKLMCEQAVDLDDTCRRHGMVPGDFTDEHAALAPMVRDGLVQIDDGRIAITDEGRPAMRVVCAAFDRHLRSGAGKHSRSI